VDLATVVFRVFDRRPQTFKLGMGFLSHRPSTAAGQA
jgi:hypothetical protein